MYVPSYVWSRPRHGSMRETSGRYSFHRAAKGFLSKITLLSSFLWLHSACTETGTPPPASDNPNSVVQIDFSRRLDQVDIPECMQNQVVNVTLADQEVACLVPRRRSSGLSLLDSLDHYLSSSPDEDPNTKTQETPGKECKMPSKLSKKLHVGSPELQSYLRAARLRWLLDRCFRFADVGVKDWRYELCIGRKVTLFKGNALAGKTVGRSLFELGTYAPLMDQLWADGTMTQWYVGGTEGRETEVLFACGDTHPRVKGISGPREGKYRIWLEAPMFCDYRDDAQNRALTESLLRSLEGWCSTFSTNGWWSYEYCHPDHLVEFHKDANGDITGPMHLLGTLPITGDAAELIFKRTNPENPTLRGTDTFTPRANGTPRFKFLPVEIIDRPLQFSKNPTPASNKVLALQLTNGTVCEGTETQRSARVIFECPVDFPVLATHRIVHIEETSFCTYDLVIHTPLVCPHPKLLPPRPLDAQHYPLFQAAAAAAAVHLHVAVALVPQAILAYPTGNIFIHNVIPASWKGLALPEDPIETKENEVRQPVNAHLEAVPEEALDLFIKDRHNAKLFGMSSYTRKRISVKEPLFSVGQIVRHRWWQYTAVVLSWDMTSQVDDAWYQKVYAVYPKALSSTPHYLLLVNTKANESDEDWPLYAYVPEASLEPLSEDISGITHPDLHQHFKRFSIEERRYVISKKAPLAGSFPQEDVFV